MPFFNEPVAESTGGASGTQNHVGAASRRHIVILAAALVLLGGCGGGAPPAAPPPPPPTYHISGNVVPESGKMLGQGVVAILVQNSAIVARVLSAHQASLENRPTARNPWPFDSIQDAVEELRRTRVISVVVLDAAGRFSFPEGVRPGNYYVCVGIPLSYDPGVGNPVPREWPLQLAGRMQIKMFGREVLSPTRTAWLLKVPVVDADRTVTLGEPERLTWASTQPTNDQRATLKSVATRLDPLLRAAESAERAFKTADEKARSTGQPFDVRDARQLEDDAKAAREKLTAASGELERLLKEIFPSEASTEPTK